MTTAVQFAEKMIRAGAPSRFRNLIIAAHGAANAKEYVADVTTDTAEESPCTASMIRHAKDRDGQPVPGTIQICAHAGTSVVWDLLHELGHALHGHAPGKEKTCAHEVAMWERGWKWAKTESGLGGELTTEDESAFRARAIDCLKTYCVPPLNL